MKRWKMELLRTTEDKGYPTDYLLSRIRGRGTYMIEDWDLLLFSASPRDHLSSARYGVILTDESPEGIWRYLLKEYGWVYYQMNRALREIFLPFFLYVELRTIFISLRYISPKYAEGRDNRKIEGLLSLSLLSKKVKKVLASSEGISPAVEGLDRIFSSFSDRFSGLGKVLDEKGLGGVEQMLSNRCLEYVVHSRPHPVIKEFFVRVLDSRNILSLYKYLRLKGRIAPPFISGGRISEKTFMKIAGMKDLREVGSLIRKLTGIVIEETDTAAVEHSLYTDITRLLRKTGGEPLGIGLILDYLWRCSIEARNLSVLFYGREIDRGVVSAELVRWKR